MVRDEESRRRRRIRVAQRYLLNPPLKLLAWAGLLPGHVLVETKGRRSGRQRRNVVGMHIEGASGWVVAEQGRHAGYVLNLEAHPEVRVRVDRRWRRALAQVVEGDDVQARLDSFGRRSHAAAVRKFGTELTTIRFDFVEDHRPLGSGAPALQHDGGGHGISTATPVGDGRVTTASLELYWIPLGAGARVVRFSGNVYERICAAVQRRPRRDLYHSALVATTSDGRYTIEMAPIPGRGGPPDRGTVAEGPVGSRLLSRLRIFRYEIRRWKDGVIPDLPYAVASPVHITDDPAVVRQVLDLTALVPTPVWGRDELRAGEMWNSNSVVSWVLTRAGVCSAAGRPPGNGRAPGWDAGVLASNRLAG